jgi:hypothetical protein
MIINDDVTHLDDELADVESSRCLSRRGLRRSYLFSVHTYIHIFKFIHIFTYTYSIIDIYIYAYIYMCICLYVCMRIGGCRTNVAHIQQSRPDSSLGFQVNVLETFQVDHVSLVSGLWD